MLPMKEYDHLEEFLAICQQIYERRIADGTWPWLNDSTNPEDVIDSDSNPKSS